MATAAVASYPPDHHPFPTENFSPAPHTCPECGTPCPHTNTKDKERIAELEAQVRMLSEKASRAADKLADYEDELRQLKAHPPPDTTRPPLSSTASDTILEPTRPRLSVDESQTRPGTSASNSSSTLRSTSRFSSLLGRKPLPPPPPNPTPTRAESDLHAALAREQAARQHAEGQLSKMSGEMEDLSVTLFQQANEMVAAERKARVKLEERVAMLERRDGEKRARLDRLESAVRRVEKVRVYLGEGT